MSAEKEHVSAHSDPQGQLADRTLARRRHHHRFFVQLVGWGIKVGLASLCYPLLAATIATHATCANSSSASLLCATEPIALLLPPFVALCILIGNITYHRRKLEAWESALNTARQFVESNEVMKGYTDMFSIYVRTKRRSYHVVTYGLLALLYSLVGFALSVAWSDFSILPWLAHALNACLALSLFVLAYFLGSAYTPGDVLVTHTLVLVVRATSPMMELQKAVDLAEQRAKPFIHNNPWWFYSG